jgi:RNA polymerase sigma-70 factor (ECF subfamily)
MLTACQIPLGFVIKPAAWFRFPIQPVVGEPSACTMILPIDDIERQWGVDTLTRVSAGDESAFRELYDRYSSALYGLALRVLRDASEAEDVLQEAFMVIWRKAATFDSERSSPFSWAVMIVRNKAIDRLRSRDRGERIQTALSEEEAGLDHRDEASAEEPVRRERRQQVGSALAQIPEEQRQAIELAFFGGLTQEEVSSRLAAPLGTIKARIRRGLLRLRELLKEEA